jgi:hypothetical protein
METDDERLTHLAQLIMNKSEELNRYSLHEIKEIVRIQLELIN